MTMRPNAEEQLEALRQQGCDAVQGYLLCRPVELEACKRFLHQDQWPLVRRPSTDRLRAVLDVPPGSQRVAR